MSGSIEQNNRFYQGNVSGDFSTQQNQEVNKGQPKKKIDESHYQDGVAIADEEAKTYDFEIDMPSLNSPNSRLLAERNAEQEAPRDTSEEAVRGLLTKNSGYQTLVEQGVPENELLAHVNSALENPSLKHLNQESVVKQALAEKMYDQLQVEPNKALEIEWYSARTELLFSANPDAKALVTLYRNEFIAKNLPNEEATTAAQKAALDYLDQTLAKGDTAKPIYGGHPDMSKAINAALQQNFTGVSNPEKAAAELQMLTGVENLIVGVLENAAEVDPTDKTEKNIGTMQNISQSAQELINEILSVLHALPIPEGDRVNLLEYLKTIAIALTEFDKMLREVAMKDRPKPESAVAKIQTAMSRMEGQLEEIRKFLKKLKKLRKKKKKFGYLGKIMDKLGKVVMPLMITMMAPVAGLSGAVLAVASIVVLISSTIGLASVALVFLLMILPIIFPPAIAITASLLFAAVVVAAIVLLVTSVVSMAAAVVAAAAAFFFLLSAGAMTLAILSHEKEDLMNELGVQTMYGLQQMLAEIGLDVSTEDMFWIMTSLPGIAVATVAILGLVVIPLILTVAAIVLLPIVLVIAMALLPLTITLIALAVIISTAAAPLFALLTMLAFVLIPLIIAAVSIILGTATALLYSQWMPVWMAESGIYDQMANNIGSVLGLSDEEKEEMSLAFRGIFAAGAALSGMGVPDNTWYNKDFNELDMRLASEREARNTSDKISDLQSWLAGRRQNMINLLEVGKERRLEEEKEEMFAKLQQMLENMKKVIEMMQTLLAGIISTGNNPPGDPATTQTISAALSEFLASLVGQSFKPVMGEGEDAAKNTAEMERFMSEFLNSLVENAQNMMPPPSVVEQMMSQLHEQYVYRDEEEQEMGGEYYFAG